MGDLGRIPWRNGKHLGEEEDQSKRKEVSSSLPTCDAPIAHPMLTRQ
jgi:hypothetical protein